MRGFAVVHVPICLEGELADLVCASSLGAWLPSPYLHLQYHTSCTGYVAFSGGALFPFTPGAGAVEGDLRSAFICSTQHLGLHACCKGLPAERGILPPCVHRRVEILLVVRCSLRTLILGGRGADRRFRSAASIAVIAARHHQALIYLPCFVALPAQASVQACLLKEVAALHI